MGLYVTACPTCKALHYWFSGNLDQRCPDCRTVKTNNADGSITNTLKAPPTCPICGCDGTPHIHIAPGSSL